MALYARVEGIKVMELLEAPVDLTDPKMACGLVFINVTLIKPQPAVHWTWDGDKFYAPEKGA